MKVGVISDTHLTSHDERLRCLLDTHFRDVDLILHAGDLVDLRVLDSFEGKEVRAVYGNMDPASVREILPDRLMLELEGHTVGVMHGWGAPSNLEQKLQNELGPVDCLVYGHTHKPANRISNGTLFFNPGSAIDRRFAAHHTIGILEIGDRIEGTIITI
jgi:putative phosphoesterase